jgi:glycosyltransferase involved in cell wall biosynthesis
MIRALAPRIGRVRHHAPRRLRIPARYQAVAGLPAPSVVALVTPSRNAASFLERTLLSVAAQAYPSLEYVVQDGGSTDGTLEILRRHRDVVTDWESTPDAGQAAALNRAFARTTGEIMGYLNADDILLSGALHYVARAFAERPDVDVVYGHRILIDENDQEIGRWVLPPHDDSALAWSDYVPQETLFWRRRVWERVGRGFDERYEIALDWELLLRFRAVRARFVRLPRFLGAFRIHGAQKTALRFSSTGRQEMARLRERVTGRAVSRFEAALRTTPYLARHLVHHGLYRLGLVRY